MKRRVDPGLLLLLTPLLWGATFPATKIILRHVGVLPFMAWTRALGFLAILAWVPAVHRKEERERLKALVEGHDWSHIGHKTADATSAAAERDRDQNAESPVLAGLS